MTNNDNSLPKISFILPVYNAEKYLKRCIDSILIQDYPKELYEIIVAYADSTDNTKSILDQYLEKNSNNIIVIDNPKRISDYGKWLAIEKSEGEILAFIDSDNILASTNWLSKMIAPLIENESLIGVESNYLFAKDFTAINTYANLIVIVDPMARLLASKPKIEKTDKGYTIKHFKKGSAPVAGANGFLWRKDLALKYNKQPDTFAETNLLYEISKEVEVSYANIPNIGVYHYYSDSFNDYIKKRKKIAGKFLNRSKQMNTWVEKDGDLKTILIGLYLISFIGPFIESIIFAIQTRRIEWLLHPFICFSTASLYGYYKLKSLIIK